MPPTRREFLQTAARALAVTALTDAVRATAARSASPRPFGFSLYGMKALPLTEAIDHCARIGYRQLELSLIPGFPSDPVKFSIESRRAVRDRIRAHGLDLASLLVNLNLAGDETVQAANREIIRRAGEVAHQVGGKTPPVVETVTGGKAAEWDRTKEMLAARLRDWATSAAVADVTLCVKAHAGQIVNSPERLLWLFRQVNHPRLALTYDYSHYQFEGLELEATMRAIIPHTRFVHLKDVVIGEKTPRYLLVGEGKIDYAKYFRVLDELKYRGPLVVEVSSQIHSRPGYDGVKAAEQAFAFLSRLASA